MFLPLISPNNNPCPMEPLPPPRIINAQQTMHESKHIGKCLESVMCSICALRSNMSRSMGTSAHSNMSRPMGTSAQQYVLTYGDISTAICPDLGDISTAICPDLWGHQHSNMSRPRGHQHSNISRPRGHQHSNMSRPMGTSAQQYVLTYGDISTAICPDLWGHQHSNMSRPMGTSAQ